MSGNPNQGRLLPPLLKTPTVGWQRGARGDFLNSGPYGKCVDKLNAVIPAVSPITAFGDRLKRESRRRPREDGEPQYKGYWIPDKKLRE